MSLPPAAAETRIAQKTLYVHKNLGRRGRNLDDASERFVDETRMTQEA
jgi:hypothetical protein